MIIVWERCIAGGHKRDRLFFLSAENVIEVKNLYYYFRKIAFIINLRTQLTAKIRLYSECSCLPRHPVYIRLRYESR